MVYLNKHTKLFKYNFAILKYNPPNLSDEDVDEGNEIMNQMERETFAGQKKLELCN